MKLGILLFLLALNVALATLKHEPAQSDVHSGNSFLAWLSNNPHEEEDCKCMTTGAAFLSRSLSA